MELTHPVASHQTVYKYSTGRRKPLFRLLGVKRSLSSDCVSLFSRPRFHASHTVLSERNNIRTSIAVAEEKAVLEAVTFLRPPFAYKHKKKMSTTTDPNGWVQNPPSVFVKVHGTSRDDYNGRMGLVLQYADDRRRYMILLCESQAQVSLKPENLVAAGMMEKATAYYQMIKNNPDVQRQFQQVSAQVQARTGLKVEYVLAIFLLSFTIGWYRLGFSKVMMLLTGLVLVLTVVGPDLAAGRDARTCLRNAPARWREVVRQQIPVVGPKIASNDWLLRGFTALIVAFVVYSLVATPNRRGVGPRTATSIPAAPAMSSELQQKYYKIGFDDAMASKEFGASLPAPEVVVEETVDIVSGGGDDSGYSSWRSAIGLEDDFAYPTIPKKKSPFTLATAFSVFTIYRILSPMAFNADGRFDLQLLRANLSNMEIYKLGILGFSVYRLVSAFRS